MLTKPINWELIRRAVRPGWSSTRRRSGLGTAETEAILRRFTSNNVQHPTYKAFADLGKAVKTMFLCRYLNDEGLRREINEGLNVIEQWIQPPTISSSSARRGELASNPPCRTTRSACCRYICSRTA